MKVIALCIIRKDAFFMLRNKGIFRYIEKKDRNLKRAS